MNYPEEKQAIEFKEATKEKIKPEIIYPEENIKESKESGISQKYRNIFNCCYTEVEK